MLTVSSSFLSPNVEPEWWETLQKIQIFSIMLQLKISFGNFLPGRVSLPYWPALWYPFLLNSYLGKRVDQISQPMIGTTLFPTWESELTEFASPLMTPPYFLPGRACWPARWWPHLNLNNNHCVTSSPLCYSALLWITPELLKIFRKFEKFWVGSVLSFKMTKTVNNGQCNSTHKDRTVGFPTCQYLGDGERKCKIISENGERKC